MLLAVTLGHEVFRRHVELFGEDIRHCRSTPIGKAEVLVVWAHRVGVSLDHHHSLRIASEQPPNGARDTLELVELIGPDFP